MTTRTPQVAPGVARLRADETRARTRGRRVTAWLSKPKTQKVAPVLKQLSFGDVLA